MSLSERSRAAIHEGLSTVIDQEAVEEMLAQFRDAEELASKRDIGEFRTEMVERFADVDRRMTQGFADADRRMTEGFAQMREKAHSDLRWTIVTVLASNSMMAGIVGALVSS